MVLKHPQISPLQHVPCSDIFTFQINKPCSFILIAQFNDVALSKAVSPVSDKLTVSGINIPSKEDTPWETKAMTMCTFKMANNAMNLICIIPPV